MKGILPNKLFIRYEVFNTGYFFSLTWENSVLVSKQFSNHSFVDESVEIVPDNEEWADFWDSLSEIDIWSWYELYEVKCIDSCVEGDEWEVDIELGYDQVESHGANSYPPAFREFLKAVEELTGILIEFIHED